MSCTVYYDYNTIGHQLSVTFLGLPRVVIGIGGKNQNVRRREKKSAEKGGRIREEMREGYRELGR